MNISFLNIIQVIIILILFIVILCLLRQNVSIKFERRIGRYSIEPINKKFSSLFDNLKSYYDNLVVKLRDPLSKLFVIKILSKKYDKFVIYGEEKTLKNMLGDTLSIKEYHTLDIVNELSLSENNTISNIAKVLNITLSTCTINVERLIAKGYLNKIKKADDKRISYIELTQKGKSARDKHENIHRSQVINAIKNLSLTERVSLFNAINKLDI